jgi:hypothetical protein
VKVITNVVLALEAMVAGKVMPDTEKSEAWVPGEGDAGYDQWAGSGILDGVGFGVEGAGAY